MSLYRGVSFQLSVFRRAVTECGKGINGPAGKPQQVQNRTFKGIWAGKHIKFGNKVSESGNKSRRRFTPNVKVRDLFSEVLQTKLPDIEVTTHALRTFDKYGGLDRYLLRSKIENLDFGLTRELRTALEVKLLTTPGLAKHMHLEDVLARLQSSPEQARLMEEVGPEALQVVHPAITSPDQILPFRKWEKAQSAERRKQLADAGTVLKANAQITDMEAPTPVVKGVNMKPQKASFDWPFVMPRPQIISRLNFHKNHTKGASNASSSVTSFITHEQALAGASPATKSTASSSSSSQ